MILGEKSLMDALGELSATDLHDAVSKGIKTVQAEAKSLCPVYDGELRDSIYTSVENGEVPAQKDRQTMRASLRMWPFPTASLPGGFMKAR